MMRTLSLLGICALGCGLALPALAGPQPADQVRNQTVAFSDLDLNGDPGARAALTRISSAARLVCDENADSVRDLGARLAQDRCLRASMESAVTRLNNPRVTAAYRGRTHSVMVTASATPSK